MTLSVRQERFCQEYVICWNGSQAARLAGYSPKGGGERVVAARLLTNPNVKKRIAELTEIQAQKNDLKASDIIDELRKIAFFNITDVIEISGGEAFAKATNKWSDQAKASVQSIKQSKEGITISAHSKIAALEKLMCRFGLNQPDPEEGIAEPKEVTIIAEDGRVLDETEPSSD